MLDGFVGFKIGQPDGQSDQPVDSCDLQVPLAWNTSGLGLYNESLLPVTMAWKPMP
jgi:hypothetical protein